MSVFSWYKIEGAAPSALVENKITEFAIEGKRICLLRRGGSVYAFTAACPHAGAPLCNGWTDALGHIVCPGHKYRFDPATGRNTGGEGYKLFTYPVKLLDGDIYIGLSVW